MGECGRRYARQHWDESRLLPRFAAQLVQAASVAST
jgi:hypothetical protein